MINIYMKNVTSKLEGDLSLVKKDLIKILSYTTKSFNSKDKIEYLFNPSNQITYTGLIPTVIDILYKKGIKYQIHDLREKPKQNANFNINKNWKPRDYQQKIIDNVSSRECIQAATGAGKTFIMANLIARFNVKPVVIIAPKISLVTQIQQEMTKFLNIKVDAYYSGINLPDNYIPNIIVSTSSIPINILKQSKMLIWDECLRYHQKVLMENGTYKEIGKLVDEKSTEKVMSYNHKTKKIESKKIINHSKTLLKQNNKKLMRLKIRKNDGTIEIIECTDNHKIWVENLSKYVYARDLVKGQKVKTISRG